MDTGPRRSLPVQLTSFVGRQRERDAVRALLGEARLVTLTGPGGVGKTRLALAAVEDLPVAIASDLWFADLSRIGDAGLVPQAVATALGLREAAGEPLVETVSAALKRSQALLVLDNCEHLLDACASLADTLLRSCAALRVLATSREPLGVPGEVTWLVPPLPLPDPHRLPLRERLTEFAAIELFVERARLANPEFALTSQNALAVAQICGRLDGIPLAIELAAARLRALSPEEVAARLDDALSLLSGGSRVLAERQQTLHATVSWSYDLLTPPERQFFDGLGVFAGGFTLDAAEAVTGQSALDLVPRLVEKSLVVVETGSAPSRYRLLEPLRQFANARLAASGAQPAARRRHAEAFLALAEDAEPALTRGDQVAWLKRLSLEHDNFRAAARWCEDERDASLGLRLAAALAHFWYVRGFWSEGLDRLERALALPGEPAHPVRAKALRGAGTLALQLDDYDRASAHFEGALALSRAAGDVVGTGAALYGLSEVACYRSDLASARTLGTQAIEHLQRANAQWHLAQALNTLGVVGLYCDDLELAQRNDSEALAIRRQLDDRRGIAWSLLQLGVVAERLGHVQQALQLLEESLAIRRELDDKQGIAYTLENMAHAALGAGELDRARELATQCLSLFGELGDRWGTATTLDRFAALAGREGRPRDALMLAGAADALRRRIGAPLPQPWQQRLARDLEAARRVLPPEEAEEASLAGAALEMADAVSLALTPAAHATPRASAPDAHPWASPPARAAGLSQREWEVLALLTAGATNPEIAARLVISRHTVVRHVSSILAKLGAATRSEAVGLALTRPDAAAVLSR